MNKLFTSVVSKILQIIFEETELHIFIILFIII